MTWADGFPYEGELLDGRQHGYGMLTKADGDSPDAHGFTVQVDMDENLPIQQPSPFGFLVWGSVNRSASKLTPMLSCLGSARSARSHTRMNSTVAYMPSRTGSTTTADHTCPSRLQSLQSAH